MSESVKIYKAGVIGATGYAGAELVRLLSGHPNIKIEAISSVSFEGKTIPQIYPNLRGICDLTLERAEDVIPRCDVVFASLPHGHSEHFAKLCLENDCLFIDLGADFRLRDAEDYKQWYGLDYNDPGLHEAALYSIPELHRAQLILKKPKIIGNPGCYPTSIALGCYPALSRGLVSTDGIIIDSKSGVTGAGRSLTQGTHYPETNEAFSAYKAGVHRHTPEIEQTLSDVAGEKIKVTFVPHLLPLNRGIESTVYLRPKDGVAFDKIRTAYEECYKDERFVRVLPDGEYANIKNIRFSNYCDISLHYDEHNDTLIVCSCIDNMVKGAAGQAIQNMNILLGIKEDTALLAPPSVF